MIRIAATIELASDARTSQYADRGRYPPFGIRREQLTDRIGIAERLHKALGQNLRTDTHNFLCG